MGGVFSVCLPLQLHTVFSAVPPTDKKERGIAAAGVVSEKKAQQLKRDTRPKRRVPGTTRPNGRVTQVCMYLQSLRPPGFFFAPIFAIQP